MTALPRRVPMRTLRVVHGSGIRSTVERVLASSETMHSGRMVTPRPASTRLRAASGPLIVNLGCTTRPISRAARLTSDISVVFGCMAMNDSRIRSAKATSGWSPSGWPCGTSATRRSTRYGRLSSGSSSISGLTIYTARSTSPATTERTRLVLASCFSSSSTSGKLRENSPISRARYWMMTAPVVPTVTWPRTPSENSPSSRRMSSRFSNSRRRWRARTSPAALGATPLGLRSNNCTPARSSRSWMRLVAAEAAMFSRMAARRIWRSSTTVRNSRRVNRSTRRVRPCTLSVLMVSPSVLEPVCGRVRLRMLRSSIVLRARESHREYTVMPCEHAQLPRPGGGTLALTVRNRGPPWIDSPNACEESGRHASACRHRRGTHQ
ncbi:protein of unknown function [Cupriavidus taiwanensis]|nr:protein of unknown function [Cupriavidus taiwanensis]SPC18417.1 hypothetical protein CT19431_MP30342 [Cupriavidus taiwanensis]